MSINANPWQGGGAASVPDASETVRGIIRIATSAEATTGTDDLTAMTPLTVKERIDAALVGGVEYKGSYTGQSLVTAEQGDMYISSGSQTLGGVSLSNGDHIIFNQDAADPVTSSMFDVIDNTETPASETVAGVIEIATNAEATAASATDKALVPSNISSIDLSSFDNDLSADDFAADHTAVNYTAANANIDGHLSGIDSALASVGGNQITLIDIKTTSFTAVSNAVYEIQSSLTVTMPGSPSEGDLIGFYAQANATPSLTVSGTIETINNVQTTSTTIEVNKRNVVWWGYDGARWQQLNDSIKVATASLAGVLETASNTETAAATATDRALTPSNIGSIDLSDADNTTSGFISDITSESLNDLSDVSYTAGAGIDNYVLTYDHSTTSWGAEAAASGGLSAVVDDTTPQLGGALDVNGQAITSASNGDVTINPDGTGDISVGADIIPDADATHTLGSEDNRFITLHSELNGAVQFKARNETGGALTKGQAVYISGVSGDVPLVSLARANSASTMPAHGLLAADVSNNADVQVISFGNLTAYNTTTHSLSLGDTVYVSAATAGALTNSAPASETNLIQNIGKVVRASATEGIIKVGGAGRSAATPNLDQDKIFLGNASNQAVSTALSSINLSSFNNDLASASETVAGVIEIATNAEAAAGTATDKALVPSNISSVDLSQADNTTSGFISGITGESINDLSDVSYTAGAGIDNYVLTYDHSTTSWGAEAAPTASAASETVAGVIEIATNAEASAGTATDKALVPSNISSIDLNQLGDVSYTAGAGIDNYVLTYDHSTTSWGAEAAAGGGGGGFTYSAVTSATTAQVDYHYSCGAGNQSFTVTLPAASSSTGQVSVKNMGTGTITVGRTGADTIDGTAANHTIDTQYTALTFISNGSNGWEIR